MVIPGRYRVMELQCVYPEGAECAPTPVVVAGTSRISWGACPNFCVEIFLLLMLNPKTRPASCSYCDLQNVVSCWRKLTMMRIILRQIAQTSALYSLLLKNRSRDTHKDGSCNNPTGYSLTSLYFLCFSVQFATTEWHLCATQCSHALPCVWRIFQPRSPGRFCAEACLRILLMRWWV